MRIFLLNLLLYLEFFCITSGFRGAEILVCKEHLLLSGIVFNLENNFGEKWVLLLLELI